MPEEISIFSPLPPKKSINLDKIVRNKNFSPLKIIQRPTTDLKPFIMQSYYKEQKPAVFAWISSHSFQVCTVPRAELAIRFNSPAARVSRFDLGQSLKTRADDLLVKVANSIEVKWGKSTVLLTWVYGTGCGCRRSARNCMGYSICERAIWAIRKLSTYPQLTKKFCLCTEQTHVRPTGSER